MAGTYTKLLFHIVFSTKGRLPLINIKLQQDLYEYIGGIARAHGAALLEIGGIPDHVHLLVKMRPTQTVSKLVGDIKANSSKWVNEESSSVRKFAWQDGYSAFTVSQSQVDVVRRYIRNQAEHHQKLTFQDELRALLKKQGIEVKEELLWG